MLKNRIGKSGPKKSLNKKKPTFLECWTRSKQVGQTEMLQNNYWTSNPNPERDTTTYRRKNKSIHKDKRKTEHHMQINRFNQTNNRRCSRINKEWNKTFKRKPSKPKVALPDDPQLHLLPLFFFLFFFLPLPKPTQKLFSLFPLFVSSSTSQPSAPLLPSSARMESLTIGMTCCHAHAADFPGVGKRGPPLIPTLPGIL